MYNNFAKTTSDFVNANFIKDPLNFSKIDTLYRWQFYEKAPRFWHN